MRAVSGILLLSLLGALWTAQPRADTAPPEVAQAPPGGDFTLRSAAGPVSTADLRGRVVLLNFGYTHCPDVCPLSLANLGGTLNRLKETELTRVKALFISLDPQRDTPEHLAEYVRYFHPALIGATGSESEVADVAARYGVQYHRVDSSIPGRPYSVSHSAATYLVNPDGELQFVFPYATPPSVVAEAVRHALGE